MTKGLMAKKGVPQNQQRYYDAIRDMKKFCDIHEVPLRLRKTILQMKRWDYFKGDLNEDKHVMFWLEEDDKSIVTPIIYNKLISILRNHYNYPTMIRFSAIDKHGKVRAYGGGEGD